MWTDTCTGSKSILLGPKGIILYTKTPVSGPFEDQFKGGWELSNYIFTINRYDSEEVGHG